MVPKRPPPPSSSSSSSSSSSFSYGSSDEEEEQQVTHLTPPPPHKEHFPSAATTSTDDDSETVEDDEEGEKSDDDDGSAFCTSDSSANPDGAQSQSESYSSDSDSGPTPLPRLETSIDSSKRMCGAPNGRKASTEKPKKRKREAEVGDSAVASTTAAAATANGGPSSKRGKKGAQKSWARPGTTPPRSITCGSAAAKAEPKAGILYPNLGQAVRLLEVESGRNFMDGQVCKVLEELKPAELTMLDQQWKRHFVAGIKYSVERMKLKKELLKYLIDTLESEE